MLFDSPYTPAHIPEDQDISRFFLRQAEHFPDKPAMIEGYSGRVLTFRQLADSVRRVALGLHQRGFKKGDVFAIYSPNLPEYAVIFHAVASLGGIITTMNPLHTADEVAFQCNDSGARFLVTLPAFLDKAQQAKEKSKLEEIFIFGDSTGAGTPFADLYQEGEPPAVSINPKEDLVALPYSSGTTGYPKGVMLTHYNLIANSCQLEGVVDVGPQDVVVGVLPFFHIYGMLVVLNHALSAGATVVTLPRFELEPFLQAMQDYKVTRGILVPPIILQLAKHPAVDRYDLSSLSYIMSGAAPLGSDLQQEASARLKCTVLQGYGLTETSPVTHCTPNDPIRIKMGSVGPSVRSTQVKIIDPVAGGPLGVLEEGEICIRGPQVMRGYLNNPEATAKMIDAEGWLHTGDIGYVDDDGYLFIVDRLKELIKYKGMQVAPAELEGLLLTHPAIADAAVIPVPDEEAGEVPKAFVVLKAGQTLSAEDVMTFIGGKVAPHKKIRRVAFVNEIPKSASGKILRRILRERERLGETSQA